MDFVDELAEFVGRNLPNEFVEAIESQLRWGADTAWREVMEPHGIGSPPKTHEAKSVELDRLRRNRRVMGHSALLSAAENCGIPNSYINVGGGHRAAFAQVGSIIVGMEPTDHIGQLPPKSDHRIKLASNHSHLLQQLEFQFGREPVNRLDPRGTTFVIIQHGVPLGSLDRSQCLLGHIALIVPTRDLLGLVISANIMGEGFRQRFIDPFDIGATGKGTLIDTVHPKVRTQRKKIRGGENGKVW